MNFQNYPFHGAVERAALLVGPTSWVEQEDMSELEQLFHH